MNVNSPAINGINSVKLYRFISLGRPRVPIVALAAEATMELGRLCREAGMDGFITEPIDPYSALKLIEILMLNAEQQPKIFPRMEVRLPATTPRARTAALLDLQQLRIFRSCG